MTMGKKGEMSAYRNLLQSWVELKPFICSDGLCLKRNEHHLEASIPIAPHHLARSTHLFLRRDGRICRDVPRFLSGDTHRMGNPDAVRKSLRD